MTEEQIMDIGGKIVGDLLMDLAKQQLVFNPCQLALSVYYPKNDTGKYLIFSSDVSPLMNFLHPIQHIDDYKDEYKIYLSKELENLRKTPSEFYELRGTYFRGVNFYDNGTLIQNSYEILRKIVFESPLVIGAYFKQCLAEGSSQKSDTLSFTRLKDRQIIKSKIWELGCHLEKALFLGSIYSHYSCTFFNFNGADYNQIFCISLFCKPDNYTKVESRVLNFLRRQSTIFPLDRLIEDYQWVLTEDFSQIDLWSEPLKKIEKFLSDQEGLNAANKDELRGQFIVELQKLRDKIKNYASEETSSSSMEKVKLVEEFIEATASISGTPSWLATLKELNRGL
ncbi:MAG TPA: hypothetical protein VF644_01350 [Pyrinomonadaceae bacterium]|jgi:hypothetical protein